MTGVLYFVEHAILQRSKDNTYISFGEFSLRCKWYPNIGLPCGELVFHVNDIDFLLILTIDIFCFCFLHSEVLICVHWFACKLICLTYGIFAAIENWNELVLRCRRADDGSNSVTEEGLLPIRPVRRLGSEFLGKRAIENLCADLIFSDEIDEDWLCQCLHKWNRPPTNDQHIDEETAPAVNLNKRGLGAILLSGKRMNNNKWNSNALNRRVIGSEFLGKRALLGSEFLGKRAIMGSEFLGKRGSSGRPNGPSGTAKIE